MIMQGHSKHIHHKSMWYPPCSGPKRKQAIKSTRRFQWHSSKIPCLYSKWGGLVKKQPCLYFGCTIAGLADPLLLSPNATMGDRGSEYKAATNIDKNIVEYFCRYLWSPILCRKIGFCKYHFTTDTSRWVQGGRHGGESGLWDDGEREKSSMILLLADNYWTTFIGWK